ncbi:LPS export ABC transporter periplasmic protein LptC [Rhodophyticola sp. SM2404]
MPGSNRYSQVVSYVKIVLPIIAIGILSTLFLLSRTPDPERAIPFANVDLEELAREQRLGSPRYAGTTNAGREVVVVAETAVPVDGQLDLISVDSLDARVELDDTRFVDITSLQGVINLETNIADLSTDVEVADSTGYTLDTENLLVNFREFAMSSPTDVVVEGPGFHLEAGSMDLSGAEGAQVLIFNGGVKVLYQLDN